MFRASFAAIPVPRGPVWTTGVANPSTTGRTAATAASLTADHRDDLAALDRLCRR